MGEIGDKRAVEPLIGALRDKSSLVRKKSAEALGLLGNKKAAGALIRAVKDKDLYVSYQACLSLGKLGDRRAVTPLIRALKDKERMYGAAEALMEINDPQAARAVLDLIVRGESDPFTQYDISDLIAKAGKPAISHLLETLRGNDLEMRRSVVPAFYDLQVLDAVDPLISMLGGDDSDCWQSAVYVLGSYENPSVNEKLLVFARYSEGREKLGAACALGLMKDERAVPYILESIDTDGFNESSSNVEQSALEAIGKPAVPQLTAALKSGNNKTRIIAIEVLSECTSGKELERLLIDALKDKDDSVRFHAALELGDCASPDATIPLIEAVKDRGFSVKGSAIRALGETGDRCALKVLIQSLYDSSEDIREDAVWALGELKDRQAIKPLSKLLESDDIKVYSGAARALAEIGDTTFMPRLIEKIAEQRCDDEKTGRHIRREDYYTLTGALVKAGKPSIGQIMKLLKSDAWQAHYIAGMALGKINTPEACEELMRAFGERRLDVIAGAHEFFIRKAIPGSEPILALALNEYSDFYMAGAYSNCGSRKMKKIALLDSIKKNYCRHCMKGVRACRWKESADYQPTVDVKVFLYTVSLLSSPE
ncbi:MAG: HEAT repeat domain-containing protein [Vulcanimicrobiota bacterium]